MLDIHCHILPNVDDGSDSMAQSEQMLDRAHACGVTTIIATPHMYQPTADFGVYHERYNAVRAAAQTRGIHMLLGYEVNYRVLAACEPEALARYCVQDTDCLLIEMSSMMLIPNWQYHFCEISKLYHPILVHPERYRYLQKDAVMLTEMRGYGLEIQIDAQALLLNMFSLERKAAKAWLASGEVDYIASDAHTPEDYAQFARALHACPKRPGAGRLHTLLRET